MNRRIKMAEIAKREAARSFHGGVMKARSNLRPITSLFPVWPLKKWSGKWCAAFVYYCCRKAGFRIPVRYPDPKVPCNFAGCYAWEKWARLPGHDFYFSKNDRKFIPAKGDIVIYDGLFDPGPHDHIGIILENRPETLLVAEGNVNDVSAVIERDKKRNIRGYVRIPLDHKGPLTGEKRRKKN
jgi:hypothetical protein